MTSHTHTEIVLMKFHVSTSYDAVDIKTTFFLSCFSQWEIVCLNFLQSFIFPQVEG
jgi:hypothetical protein